MSGPTLGDYVRLVRDGGWSRAWNYFWEAQVFDLLRGTETAHWRPKETFSLGLPNVEYGYRYDASYTSEVRRCLEVVSGYAPARTWDFFDLGCGKGKVMIMAARSGFRSVTGIEYAPDLAAIARNNLEIVGAHARVIEGDASIFSAFTPRCVVYLFNPFGKALLARVLLELERTTRECIVIYNNPTHSEVFAGWRDLDRTHGRHAHQVTHIFHHTAATWH